MKGLEWATRGLEQIAYVFTWLLEILWCFRSNDAIGLHILISRLPSATFSAAG